AQKTMYGGKRIAEGDTVYIFACGDAGGPGPIARGIVTSAAAVPKRPDLDRQTPRVTITVRRPATARPRLGRAELKPWNDWSDERSESELNFKLYRQATNKVVGISDRVAEYLAGFFLRPSSCTRGPALGRAQRYSGSER